MKCAACGSEWHTIKTVQQCPFCGAELTQAFELESKSEQWCPVCGKALPEGNVCPECGYDPNCHTETFGTIRTDSPSRMKTFSRQVHANKMPEQTQSEIEHQEMTNRQSLAKKLNLLKLCEITVILCAAIVLHIFTVMLAGGYFSWRNIIYCLIALVMPGLYWLAVSINWNPKQMKILWIASLATLGIQLAAAVVGGLSLYVIDKWVNDLLMWTTYIDGNRLFFLLLAMIKYQYYNKPIGFTFLIFILSEACFVAKNVLCVCGLWQYRKAAE